MNLQQERSIKKTKGPCIILAGAGTGKTYTIVEKIKYLIKNEIYNPKKIVCLTFSNEAANSLTEKTLKSLNSEKEPLIRTFHSFSSDLLRKYGEKIGISKNFRILLPDDAKILLHKNFSIQPYYCHKYINTIGIAKDLGITIEQFSNYLEKKDQSNTEELEKKLEILTFQLQISKKDKESKETLKEEIKRIANLVQMKKFLNSWKAYEKIKIKRNLLDYSDLNQQALKLLIENPEISNDFEYIIVDEFQDTNKLQTEILKYLAPKQNITVVGDLNQSIYRFRGAYKNNITDFKKDFNTSDSDLFALDKSFRSTNKILNAAYNLIQNNYKDKSECFEVKNAFKKEGEKIEIYELKNGKEETRKIIEIIKKELESGTQPEKICVMFRSHQQSRQLKNSLEYENIPYTSITKKSLFKTNSIRITLDYLIILNKLKLKSKGSDQAWWDLIHFSNFSHEDIIKITKLIKENKGEINLGIMLLNKLPELNLSEKGKVKVKILINRIKSLIPSLEKNLTELLKDIYKINALDSTENPNYKENILILEKFHALVKEYSENESQNLNYFLEHINAINSLGIEIEAPVIENSGIRIMTNHSTKGLEYKTVIVTNLAQKRFPMEKISSSLIPREMSPEISKEIENLEENEKENFIESYEKASQLAEERRLCYVAFTRAKEKLIITYSKKYGNFNYLPSQFLNEINYKSNPSIDFKIDLEEKFQDPIKNVSNKNFWNNQQTITHHELKRKKVFSPSALQIFNECQKRYEYKYIYNMPDPEPTSWDALKLGSFVHLVFEKGVSSNLKSEKEFLDLAKTLNLEENWNFIDISQALPLIKIFFHRNNGRYNEKSLTEQKLFANVNGFRFMGIADRIDFHEDGLEIVDYKTGNSDIKPKYRNWQLGFYALASEKYGKPKKLVLDMLKKENAIEFVLDDKGNAKEIHSARTSFNLDEVKSELTQTAKNIISCEENGFKPCPVEKNCSFCNEYVWEI